MSLLAPYNNYIKKRTSVSQWVLRHEQVLQMKSPALLAVFLVFLCSDRCFGFASIWLVVTALVLAPSFVMLILSISGILACRYAEFIMLLVFGSLQKMFVSYINQSYSANIVYKHTKGFEPITEAI